MRCGETKEEDAGPPILLSRSGVFAPMLFGQMRHFFLVAFHCSISKNGGRRHGPEPGVVRNRDETPKSEEQTPSAIRLRNVAEYIPKISFPAGDRNTVRGVSAHTAFHGAVRRWRHRTTAQVKQPTSFLSSSEAAPGRRSELAGNGDPAMIRSGRRTGLALFEHGWRSSHNPVLFG